MQKLVVTAFFPFLIRTSLVMMKTVFLSLALFFTLTGLLFPETGWAQETADIVDFSSTRFEEWSKALTTRTVKALGKPEITQIEPELVKAQNILAERLRQERWTTDTSIHEIVDAWMEYESPRPNQDGKRDAQGHLLPGTIACIDQLIPLLQNRELLQARLHGRKGYFLFTDRRYAESSVEYEQAIKIYAPLSSEVELSRVGNMNLLANMQATLGNKEKADAMYLEIMSVPWVFVSDRKTKEGLRDIQTRAGSALIRLREGDLRSLQRLYPATETIPRLREELEKAIKAATPHNSLEEKPASDVVNQQNLRELQEIDSLGRAKNFDALAKLVAELSTRADHESPHFVSVLQALCNSLTTYDYGADTYRRSYQLAQKCARLALEQANKLSLAQEVNFIRVLGVNVDYKATNASEDEQAKLRSEKAALMLHPIKRINEIKRIPAYNGVILMVVPPPPGVEGENGISPSKIKDPVLRAQYEKAINENSERLEQANLRRRALNAERSWLPAVEKYLMEAYAKLPFAVDELKRLMDEAQMSTENKNRILEAVTKQPQGKAPL